MFTKTTLNKTKKAQVVEMYLDLQAQKINNETDYEEYIDELEVQLANFRTIVKSREEKLQELTLENKELKQKVEGFGEAAGVMMTDNTKLTEENKKLKIPEEIKNSFEDLASCWFGDEEDWYRENYLDGTCPDGYPEQIPTKDLEDSNYKQLRVLWDWLIDGKYEEA